MTIRTKFHFLYFFFVLLDFEFWFSISKKFWLPTSVNADWKRSIIEICKSIIWTIVLNDFWRFQKKRKTDGKTTSMTARRAKACITLLRCWFCFSLTIFNSLFPSFLDIIHQSSVHLFSSSSVLVLVEISFAKKVLFAPEMKPKKWL